MPKTLADALEAWRPALSERFDRILHAPRIEEVGRIERVGDGVALVSGLPNARTDELLVMPGGTLALVLELGERSIGCLLLGDYTHVMAGDRVHGTGEIVRAPVGDSLLGRVLDPLGQPLDGGGPITAERYDPVERPAPTIVDRDLVRKPLQTGTLVIDAMFPIGRGQRELIVGDRSTGKTSLAVDTIINQRRSDVLCIYVAIGQKSSDIGQVIEAVRAHDAIERCLFVIAQADAPPGLQWLAPYVAFSMAEFFRDRGQDALVVIDDLTKHAAAHRQIALLLRQPPGREAYPGDIFYLHSRLLERAAKLKSDKGGGSLTALPIAETQAENLSAYIPTNLISITDGQIYLSTRLFGEGHKPAVDVGRSVSRVGGKAQAPALRRLAERLRLDYTQFIELEIFTRFGAITDERTRRAIRHGQRLRALLDQPRHAVLSPGAEVGLLLALGNGTLDRIELDQVPIFRARLSPWLERHAGRALARIEETGDVDDDAAASLAAAANALADELPGRSRVAS
jgi:F-type H+-transporting ATPase subunit alpha